MDSNLEDKVAVGEPESALPKLTHQASSDSISTAECSEFAKKAEKKLIVWLLRRILKFFHSFFK